MSAKVNNSICGIVIAVLLSLCIWLSYQLVDQSVALDHQTQHAELINKQRNLVVNIFNSVGMSVDESSIREILKELPDDLVFEKEKGHVVADQVSFFFINGKLNRVDVGQPE
jgi:hypothetical protein